MNDHEGWTRPLPENGTEPTYWPAALAAGVTVTLWGFVTTPVVMGMGAAVGITAIVGWVREIVHAAPAVDSAQDTDRKEVVDDG